MNMTRHIILAAFASSTLLSGASQAFSQYQSDVPNGAVFRCLTCHDGAGGGEGWNVFGEAILNEGGCNPGANPQNENSGCEGIQPEDHWFAVCSDDSDGDGATNGEELGDPACEWTAGDGDPSGDISNPGDPESTPGAAEGEGEGEGEGDTGGCATTGTGTAAPLGLALALGALLRRRRVR